MGGTILAGLGGLILGPGLEGILSALAIALPCGDPYCDCMGLGLGILGAGADKDVALAGTGGRDLNVLMGLLGAYQPGPAANILSYTWPVISSVAWEGRAYMSEPFSGTAEYLRSKTCFGLR